MPGLSLQNSRTLRDCRSTPRAVLHVPCAVRAVPMASRQNLDQSRWPLLSLYVWHGATQISSLRRTGAVWCRRRRGRTSQVRSGRTRNLQRTAASYQCCRARRSRTLGQAHMPIADVRQASRAIRQKVLLQGARPSASVSLQRNGVCSCRHRRTY